MRYVKLCIIGIITILCNTSCNPFTPVDFPMSSQETPCNEQIPIVFAHGLLASGDTYSLQVQRFEQNGYCSDRMFAFDYNTIGLDNNKERLKQFIQEVLKETGSEKIFLVGHSAGSSLSYDFLKQPFWSPKIEKYVHIGGNPFAKPAGTNGDIPTLNIWSPADYVVAGGSIPGAINLELAGKDHFEVASSEATFIAMYQFFNGLPPETSAIQATAKKTISGKALSFGENIPAEGGAVEIYAVNPATGARINETPDASFTADEYGFWGPFEATANTYYEFLVYTGKSGDRPVHYYTEPFLRSNSMLYLRTYPPPGALGRTFLSGVPKNDNQSISAFFGANQSVVAGRDELFVDGNEISIPNIAAAEKFSVAIFLYDNGNQVTGLNTVGAFDAVPFLVGVDFYKQTETAASTEYVFNGNTINVPNWKSDSEGISVVIFN